MRSDLDQKDIAELFISLIDVKPYNNIYIWKMFVIPELMHFDRTGHTLYMNAVSQ